MTHLHKSGRTWWPVSRFKVTSQHPWDRACHSTLFIYVQERFSGYPRLALFYDKFEVNSVLSVYTRGLFQYYIYSKNKNNSSRQAEKTEHVSAVKNASSWTGYSCRAALAQNHHWKKHHFTEFISRHGVRLPAEALASPSPSSWTLG